jgi:hypothetical protein
MGLERPIGNFKLLENELLQVDISLPAACPMSLEDLDLLPRAEKCLRTSFRAGLHALRKSSLTDRPL